MLILASEGFFGADGFRYVLKFYPGGVGSRALVTGISV